VLASIDPLIAAAQQRQRAAARGQMDLFGAAVGGGGIPEAPASSSLVSVKPADRKDVLAWEKETLGLYLSAHPLTDLTGSGVPDGYLQVADIAERAPGSKAKLLGMVVSVRRIGTRNNRTMAVLEVEDLTGTIEVVAFPDCWEQQSELLVEDRILAFNAKVDERGDSRQLILESASDDLPEVSTPAVEEPPVEISIRDDRELWQVIRWMQEIDAILERHEGTQPVEIRLSLGQTDQRLRSRKRRVEWSAELERELQACAAVRAVHCAKVVARRPNLVLLPRVA